MYHHRSHDWQDDSMSNNGNPGHKGPDRHAEAEIESYQNAGHLWIDRAGSVDAWLAAPIEDTVEVQQ
jgi:cytochrome c peroxidase